MGTVGLSVSTTSPNKGARAINSVDLVKTLRGERGERGFCVREELDDVLVACAAVLVVSIVGDLRTLVSRVVVCGLVITVVVGVTDGEEALESFEDVGVCISAPNRLRGREDEKDLLSSRAAPWPVDREAISAAFMPGANWAI